MQDNDVMEFKVLPRNHAAMTRSKCIPVSHKHRSGAN